MYGKRRFRRNRGIWFPADQDTFAVSTVALATGAVAGNTAAVGSSLMGSFDQPPDLAALASTTGMLSVALGGAYMLKRVVGKVFAESSEAAAGGDGAVFFAGLAVDRVSSTGVVPIANWNPFTENTAQKRWLWRRTWRLWGSGAFGVPTAFSTNYLSGQSVLDGPHIDCKMKARVTFQERLFMVFAMQSLSAGVKNGLFRWHLRIFGNPIKADNR